jgi:N-acetylmuramoyl-L-alanine amidase
MKHRFLGAIVTAACMASATALAAAPPETPRELYTRALAQERLVRDDATHPTLAQMRRVVALYESLVRKHPASGYCDNALWQGGNLAALAFERFGDEADRRSATRLLTLLKTGYPASKLVAQVPDALAQLSAATTSALPAVLAVPAVARETPASIPVAADRPATSTTTSAPTAPSNRRSKPDTATGDVTLLKDVKRTVLPDGVRLTVELDGEIAYHQEEIANPRRLFFDLKNVKTVASLQDASLKFDDDVVKEIRLGRHPQNTTRVVVDLDGVGSYTVYPLYGPYRLVIDLRRASAGPVAAAVAPPMPIKALPFAVPPPLTQLKTGAPAMPVSTAARPTIPLPPPAPRAPVPSLPERADVKGPAPAGIDATAPPTSSDHDAKQPLPSKPAPASLTTAAPAANSNGKFSLSRQLGLGVARVVIDAGHGGHDPGAHGNGVNEAELTLDVALRLQALLEKSGVEVVMTRDSDVFIPLEERTAIANRDGADLFLSIHANASRNAMAHGIETYYLNFATNPEAEAVAARENATSGQPMHSLPDIVKAIALNNKINESRELAETVQKSMVKRLSAKNKATRDLGVKQAPFVVLIGAAMPSVLAEISFVTNKQDGTLLKTQTYRQQIAQALMDAVQNYQQSLKHLNGIAGKKATNQ